MINLNGVLINSIEGLEAAMTAANIPEENKQVIRNDFHGIPNAVITPEITLLNMVADKIAAARVFGIRVIARYGASNVLAGYNVNQIQDIMIKTAGVQAALNAGSLYVAIDEINKLPLDDSIITNVKVALVRNEIEDYLGIPRT